jgi:hypothetical protein
MDVAYDANGDLDRESFTWQGGQGWPPGGHAEVLPALSAKK